MMTESDPNAPEALIPLTTLAADPDVWGELTPAQWARRIPDEVLLDEFGRQVVTHTTALALADEHREQKVKMAEAAARRAAQRRPQPVPAGVPAVEGAETGVESLMLSPNYVPPSDDLGGFPQAELLS